LPFVPYFIGQKMIKRISCELSTFTPLVSSGGRGATRNTTLSPFSNRATRKETVRGCRSIFTSAASFGGKRRVVMDTGSYFPSSGIWWKNLAGIGSISTSGPSIRIGVRKGRIPGISFGLSSRQPRARGRRRFAFGPYGATGKRREFPGLISPSGHFSSNRSGIWIQTIPKGNTSCFPSIGVSGRKGKGK